MRVLIVFGTSEGQTQTIARFVAERLLKSKHKVLTINANQSQFIPQIDAFDAVIIAASLHAGHYQRSVVQFVKQHAARLAERPNAFLAISLTAAGADADDRAGLERCVNRFIKETGWTPASIRHVAGALRYRAYGFFKRWLMQRIAARRGGPTDTRRNHELTNWADLAGFIDAFARQSSAQVSTASGAPQRH